MAVTYCLFYEGSPGLRIFSKFEEVYAHGLVTKFLTCDRPPCNTHMGDTNDTPYKLKELVPSLIFYGLTYSSG